VKRAAIAFSSVAFPLILLLAGVVAAQSAPPRKDIPAIAKAANGVIVSIITSDKNGKPVAQGTGFLVNKDGRIVTNYHVIKGASSAIVKLPDGAFYDVDGVVAFDKARDLAVIKAHGQNFRVVTLGNSDRVQVGEEIVAIGSPLSLESTVSSGIVSGIRTIKEEGGKFLQITAPISPGSSGGPLFNMAGEVVGITTLYLKGGENLNFAIPVNDVKLLLATGSKVQDFPVETSDPLANLGTPATPNAAPSPSVSPTAARAFYKQFYDTGKLDGLIPTLVCFDDDPKNSRDFFTLEEEVYNERYAKSANAHVENLKKERSGEVVDDTEAWQTMRSIEASEPDVFFIDDDSLALTSILYGTDTQEYLRGGGRVMLFGNYVKGMAPSIDSVFRWSGPGTGNSWFRDFPPPRPDIKAGRLLLQIDPTTRRYRMGDELTFGDGTSLREDQRIGTCERIPTKQSASNTKERSPTEVFNLRSQCAQLGKAIDEWSTHDKTALQSVVANYSVKDNRCYVDLRFLVLSGEMAAWDDNTLYDGQTREALAYSIKDGRTGRSGISDKFGGILVNGRLDMPDECFKTPPNTDEAVKQAGDCSFDKANAYIEERMKRDDQ